MHPHYGYRALALGTSLGGAVNVGVLLLYFGRRHGGLFPAAVVLALARMGCAAAVMGLVLQALAPLGLGAAVHAAGFAAGPLHVPLWRALLGLALLTGVGGLVYGGLCRLMRVGEVEDVLAALRRRLPAGRRPPQLPGRGEG
jgi:peptidoglycan biosynthesis protein MviN/MurJ (putative lipid II flippase)